jgi:hypothetical protein
MYTASETPPYITSPILVSRERPGAADVFSGVLVVLNVLWPPAGDFTLGIAFPGCRSLKPLITARPIGERIKR